MTFIGADNRWGPKPRYNSAIAINSTDKIGDPIKSFPALDALVPATGQADSAVGLDGYWERRARNEGAAHFGRATSRVG